MDIKTRCQYVRRYLYFLSSFASYFLVLLVLVKFFLIVNLTAKIRCAYSYLLIALVVIVTFIDLVPFLLPNGTLQRESTAACLLVISILCNVYCNVTAQIITLIGRL